MEKYEVIVETACFYQTEHATGKAAIWEKLFLAYREQAEYLVSDGQDPRQQLVVIQMDARRDFSWFCFVMCS